MSDRKAVIKNADMSEEMQQDAVDCAAEFPEGCDIEWIKVSVFTSFTPHTVNSYLLKNRLC